MKKEKESRVRIGVIGIGHLGAYHLQKYREIGDCSLAAVADIVGEKAEEAGREYGCAFFTDPRELIGRVDAVSVTVPTEHHFGAARELLASGIDVLMEKPITATLEEADELIALAESSGAILQIGLIERFNPAITALDGIMGTPLFIESHRLHPFFNRGTDVDVVLDLMIHDLDIILHYVHSPIRRVEAVGIPVLSDKIDIANARITFRNGCVANVTASRVTGKKMQKIRFFGPEGYHSVDYGKRELVSLARKMVPGGEAEITPNLVEVEAYDPLEREIRAFVHSVITRDPPAVSGREGRRSLELAGMILEKMNKGEGYLK